MQFPRKSHWLVFVSAAMLLLPVVILFPHQTRADHFWVIGVVDQNSKLMGNPNSIAIDSNDVPHIAYVDSINGYLKYAYEDVFRWEVQVVDLGVNNGVSLALDASDNPHIGYHDGMNEDLKYARWNGTDWDIQTVDSEGDVGFSPSIDLDSLGNPHIAYADATNIDLKYARWNGTGWSIETVDSEGDVGIAPHLVLDSSDRPRISYQDSTNSDLKYAYWTGTEWIFQSIDTSNRTGYPNFMALDSEDNPHITYYDYTAGSLKYVNWNGTTWNIEVVKAIVGPTDFVGLAMDSKDSPHIAYCHVRPLYYLSRSGFTWDEEAVGPIFPSSCDVVSLALDSRDRPYVALSAQGSSGNNPTYLKCARTIPPPSPDLTLSSDDISFEPTSPVLENATVKLTATIHNIGGYQAFDVGVRFHDGVPPAGEIIGADELIGYMPPESISNASTDWVATSPGPHEICVTVDPTDSIVEFDETNNVACKSIEVINASIPSPPSITSASLTNAEFQDVFVEWNLSADDIELDRYEIYRGSEYSSTGAGYSLHDWVSAGTSYYIDQNAGEGNPSDYFYCVCAVNPSNLSSCSSIQAGKFTRPLGGGPNFVSIPLIQSNESIERALQTVKYDMVWRYDSLFQQWKWHMTHKEYRRGLFNLNSTMGVWINATEDCNMTVAGVVPAQTTIHLYEGWNLVSYPSVNASHTVGDVKASLPVERVEGFDPIQPYFLRVLSDSDVLLAGRAYWVKAQVDVDWAVIFK